MTLLSRWLTATSGVLTVAAVTLGRRRLMSHHDVEMPPLPVRLTPLQDIRGRLTAAKADVRLGGLRDWVVYGERSVEHRQPALDVLCQALRELPWPGTEVDQRWRMVLQATVAAHLRPGRGSGWAAISTCATPRWSTSTCRSAGCVMLVSPARGFWVTRGSTRRRSSATSTRTARSSGGTCCSLSRCSPAAWACGGTTVCGNGEFSSIHAAGPVTLRGARFSGRADFTCARFGSELDCSGVRFGGRALFRRAWFAGSSSFAGAWFRGREDFVDAAFGGESFENTRFGHRVHAD